VIKAIRRNDPDNIILVGCPHWDQDINLVAESPLKGFSNIMYTVHYYAGTHKDYLRNLTEQAIEQGVPVFLSESGAMEASGDGPIDYESQQKWVDMLEKHHVSWIGWSVSDKNETCSMLLPRASSTGPWADDVIKPYGKLVKKILQKNVQQ
jgi:endoglucanase